MSDPILWAGSSREVAKVDRALAREIAVVRGRARVIEAQHIASVEALQSIGSTALFTGAALTQQAQALAQTVPGSAPFAGRVLDQVSLAIGQVIQDAARDLRS